jgi:Domain of Unknown Function with PDB structure (DUF3857)/Transglutaminase-like superfamily
MPRVFPLLCYAPIGALVLAASGASALAEEAPFSQRLDVKAVPIAHDLLELVTTVEVTIRSEAVLNTFGQATLPINTHFADLDILEAATLKGDARQVDVPADRILVADAPNAPQLGMFNADVRTRTIVFPDVALGDTIHYKTRIREKARGIAGGLSLIRSVAPSWRMERLTIEFDAPPNVALQEDSVGFDKTARTQGDHTILTWSLRPLPFRPDEAGSTHIIDRAPRLILSSYADWQTIGKVFYDGAAPMSEPTSEIGALAKEITKGVADRREQARLIHEWVSKNVRYFAVFLGQGGFVPHSAGSVLLNKYGDCKDHVTLMRALLAAKGIEAEYGLVSLAPIYQTPKVPAPDWFNHVILWLPEFDLYLDPTASHASFDSLPFADSDKAVLRVGKSGTALVRTPPLSADSNHLSVTADVTLYGDGTTKGTAVTRAMGPVTATLRATLANAALKGREALAKDLLGQFNWRGIGNIEPPDLVSKTEPLAVKTSFELTNRFFGDGDNINTVPTGPRLVASAFGPYAAMLTEKRTQNFLCEAQTYEQTIDFHLPDGHPIVNVPAGITVEQPLATYVSRYALRDRTLRIERRFIARVPGQSCSAQTVKDMSAVIEAALKDFNWQPHFAKAGQGQGGE